MRVVLDTNVIVSAIFWHSKPHSILELIRSQQLEGWTSEALLAELLEVLSRNKFSSRLGSHRNLTAGHRRGAAGFVAGRGGR